MRRARRLPQKHPRLDSAPLFLRLALYRRRRRVLHLEPVAGAPGGIARAQTLADDALEPEFAGVAENDVAWLGDVLVELQPAAGVAQQRGELALADLEAARAVGPARRARADRRHRGTRRRPAGGSATGRTTGGRPPPRRPPLPRTSPTLPLS